MCAAAEGLNFLNLRFLSKGYCSFVLVLLLHATIDLTRRSPSALLCKRPFNGTLYKPESEGVSCFVAVT